MKQNKKEQTHKWRLFCIEQLLLDVGPAVECGWCILWHPTGEKGFFLSQQVSIANTSWLGDRLCLCFSRLACCLAYISTGLVNGITVTVHSNGISLVVLWRSCFLLSHPWHLVLTTSPFLFHTDFWALNQTFSCVSFLNSFLTTRSSQILCWLIFFKILVINISLVRSPNLSMDFSRKTPTSNVHIIHLPTSINSKTY